MMTFVKVVVAEDVDVMEDVVVTENVVDVDLVITDVHVKVESKTCLRKKATS